MASPDSSDNHSFIFLKSSIILSDLFTLNNIMAPVFGATTFFGLYHKYSLDLHILQWVNHNQLFIFFIWMPLLDPKSYFTIFPQPIEVLLKLAPITPFRRYFGVTVTGPHSVHSPSKVRYLLYEPIFTFKIPTHAPRDDISIFSYALRTKYV